MDAPGSREEAPVALSLPGMEGVLNPLEESQLRSAEARRLFESLGEAEPWMEEYFTLIGEGWTWRQAVWMLWSAQPASTRWPRTQQELATQVLGLTTDRVIWDWKERNPALETRVRRLMLRALFHARAEVLATLVRAATNDSYRYHPDRRLFLEIIGDYQPHQAVEVRATAAQEWQAASTEELLALAAGGEEK